MEMLQLRYFHESAKNGSFAKTAEKFMVPTTSVSSSVKRLEEELGCKLFDRTPNRILLNKNGKRFQQSMCVIFKELDEAVSSLKASDDDREIRILVRSIRSDVTDYIIEYNQKHPRIAFKTVFDFNEQDYGKYDVIIDEKSDKYPEHSGFELSTMRIRMKVVKNSHLVSRKLKLSDLAAEPFISWGEDSNMHKLLINACRKAGFTPNIVVWTNDKKCYERLLHSGVGIGLGREDEEVDLPDLAYLDVTDFVERYTVYCYCKEQSCYGNVKHFVDFLRGKI